MSQWSINDAYLGGRRARYVWCRACCVLPRRAGLAWLNGDQSDRKAATSGSPVRQCGSRCTWLSATCRDTGTTRLPRAVCVRVCMQCGSDLSLLRWQRTACLMVHRGAAQWSGVAGGRCSTPTAHHSRAAAVGCCARHDRARQDSENVGRALAAVRRRAGNSTISHGRPLRSGVAGRPRRFTIMASPGQGRSEKRWGIDSETIFTPKRL